MRPEFKLLGSYCYGVSVAGVWLRVKEKTKLCGTFVRSSWVVGFLMFGESHSLANVLVLQKRSTSMVLSKQQLKMF